MKKLVFATHNAGKLLEMQQLLAPTGIELVTPDTLGIPDVEETGLTFVENAILKARHALQYTDLPVLADDSGLEVDALQGEPGLYTARYAGYPRSSDANMAKLLAKLEGVPDAKRTARFYCVLVLLRYANDPAPVIAQGSWYGRILTAPIGTAGFGYNPVFYVPTHHCSAAQLADDVKNQLSHRAQALQALLKEIAAWV